MITKRNKQKTAGYLNAIVVLKLSTGKTGFAKYHNIKDQAAPLARFHGFICNKFTRNGNEVMHINYYDVISRNFTRQIPAKNGYI